MKRRQFISALLGTLVAGATSHTAAQTQKKATPAQKTPAKKAAPKKPAAKKTKKKEPPKNNPENTVATPEKSIIDKPVKGGTTDNLPPLKAPGAPEAWRNFEVVYQFELPDDYDALEVFAPLPCDFLPFYQHQKRFSWQGQVAAEILHLPPNRAQILKITAPEQGFFSRKPRGKVEIKMEVALAARRFNVGRRSVPPENEDILRENLKETEQIPNRGPARALALQIIQRIQDPLAQARAIYDWVIDNAVFLGKMPHAGDATTQILSKSYGGNSADIGALFVALCRAIGIPARNIYGVTLAGSQVTKNLALSTNFADNAHTKSEFYIPGYGWIGVDVGTVVKAASNVAAKEALKKHFFGFWEPNWLALHWGSLEKTLPLFPVLNAPVAVTEQKIRSDFAPQISFREIL